MSDQGLNEIVQYATLAQAQRLRHAEQASHEAAARFAVRAERTLALDHRWPQRPFHGVVGRLNPFAARERPQRRLQLQDPGAYPRRLGATARSTLPQQAPHLRAQPTLDWLPQPAPAARPVAHLVP